MKKMLFIFILLLLLLWTFNTYSQVRDTVVVIVDTCAHNVEYSEEIVPNGHFNYINADSIHGKKEFMVCIGGHYYDGTSDEDFAMVCFSKLYRGNGSINIKDSEIIVEKKELSKYTVVYGSQLSKQLDLQILSNMIGSHPSSLFSGRHFLVFKSDLDNISNSIIMHSVYIGCNEVDY